MISWLVAVHLNFRVRNIYFKFRAEILHCFPINLIALALQCNYFLRHFNANLFICLHIGISLSCVLSEDVGSALAIISFSVRKPHFLAPKHMTFLISQTMFLTLSWDVLQLLNNQFYTYFCHFSVYRGIQMCFHTV